AGACAVLAVIQRLALAAQVAVFLDRLAALEISGHEHISDQLHVSRGMRCKKRRRAKRYARIPLRDGCMPRVDSVVGIISSSFQFFGARGKAGTRSVARHPPTACETRRRQNQDRGWPRLSIVWFQAAG